MPDVSSMSELLGAGLIMMAISAPLTVGILKLGNNKDRKIPCNSCDKLARLVERNEAVTTRLETASQDAQNLMGVLRDIRKHVLSIEGVMDGGTD